MLKIIILLLLSLVINSGCTTVPSEQVPYYQLQTLKPYDEVINELEVAIADHNFRITAHSRVGKVIRDRGTENFPEYDTIQFCNLTLAKVMLEIQPQAIGFMPCNVVTYQQENLTVIKIHLLPEDNDNQALNEFAITMNQALKQIVDFAAKP